MARDTVTKTFVVAALLCIVCSVLVSSAAVVLRPTQAVQKLLDKKRNILGAAGLVDENKSIDELFESIEARVVDLASGEYVEGINAETFDQRAAAKDLETSREIPKEKDLGGIKRRAKQAAIYLVFKKGEVDKVILPVRGKGLWSTLYGFLALDREDLNTIRSLVYYEHGETPGLGGEVENPQWKALWNGKQAFAADGKTAIEVLRGKVDPDRASAIHQVDGLSGATITSRGVSNMLRYWLSEDAFGPYLNRLKRGEG
jgi:Na+-transporting NADH:ubiquinone oxidoreductase subunit C